MELEQLPIIDWELGTKLAGNKREFAEEMLTHLVKKTLPEDIHLIRQLYSANKHYELLKQVHRLHGAVCYCGIPRLKKVLAHLERDLKSNIMDNLPTLFNQLNTEVTLLLEHFPRHLTN